MSVYDNSITGHVRRSLTTAKRELAEARAQLATVTAERDRYWEALEALGKIVAGCCGRCGYDVKKCDRLLPNCEGAIARRALADTSPPAQPATTISNSDVETLNHAANRIEETSEAEFHEPCGVPGCDHEEAATSDDRLAADLRAIAIRLTSTAQPSTLPLSVNEPR